MQLIKSHLKEGVWEGLLVGNATPTPEFSATYLGETLKGLNCEHVPDENAWRITLPVPARVLSDGLQTIIIRDASDTTVATVPLLCGHVLDDDLRAEIALLRGELTLLQKAFRKHCR